MPVTTIQLRSDDLAPDVIDNVIVEFYDLSGGFVTSGTTDGSGDVTVTLPAASYDILMFKQGVTFLPKQPQRIVVLTQVPPNVFMVIGHVRSLPVSPDPSLCRVSGYFIDGQGKPQKGVKISIGPNPELITINLRNLVDPDSVFTVTSDDKGYVEFDLLRTISYEAFILYKDEWKGMPPGRLSIKAPDEDSVELQDLLFPTPAIVDFSTLSLTVGIGAEDNTTTITITFTDKNTRQASLEWGGLVFINSDATVFDYEIAGSKVIIKGIAAGTATLTAQRTLPPTSVLIPEPPFSADILTVTVA